MQVHQAVDEISHGESKSDSQATAVALEYVEEEPEPHLHLKTWLILAVRLLQRNLIVSRS